MDDKLKQKLNFFKNGDKQQTSLAIALRKGEPLEIIEKFLSGDAAVSVFVKGYFPNSLVCTLPMAQQPPSRSFLYDEPLKGVKPEMVIQIDKAVAEHIDYLVALKADQDVTRKTYTGTNDTSGNEIGSGISKKYVRPVTGKNKATGAPVSPAVGIPLAVGNHVRRGPSWKWNDQDHKSGSVPCVGIILTVNGDDIRVRWGKDPLKYDGGNAHENVYRNDPSKSIYDLVVVDPDFKPMEKLRVGDKVRLVPQTQGSSLYYFNHVFAAQPSKFVCKICSKKGASDTGTKECSKCHRCEKCCLVGADMNARLSQHFKDAGYVPLIDHTGHSNIQTDYKVTFGGFATIVGDVKLRATTEMSKFYYEVESLDYKATAQFGWITEGFTAQLGQKGVGDDENGWAVDGCRQQKWGSGTSASFGSSWRDGHVIGIAIDLEKRTMSASYDGSWSSPNGEAFSGISVPAGWVTPALTAHDDSVYKVNFGERAMKHAPPDASYVSVYTAFRAAVALDGEKGAKVASKDSAKKLISDRCLGCSADERIGVVIKTSLADADTSKRVSTNCCTGTHLLSKLTLVTVMSTAYDDALCDYVDVDLQYADGSTLASQIKTVTKPPSKAASRTPQLKAGDRVVLASSFKENGGDGWCLGKMPVAAGSDPKVGVVLLAQDPQASADQRGVLVASVDDPTKVFSFRSSWLERVVNDGTREYKLGDRVQLDVANCPDELCDPQVIGKCLGLSSQAIYGRVVNVGVMREGSQRNIEVVAVGGPNNGKVSLYSSPVLVPAVRRAVITDQDRAILDNILRHFLTARNITEVNASKLLVAFGYNLWGRLMDVAVSVKGLPTSEVLGVWEAWERERDMFDLKGEEVWPSDEPSQEAIEFVYRDDAAAGAGINGALSLRRSYSAPPIPLAYRLPLPLSFASNWVCKYSDCEYTANPPNKANCLLCKRKAEKWRCIACTAINRSTARACVVCFTHRGQEPVEGGTTHSTVSEPLRRLAADAAEEASLRAAILLSDNEAKLPLRKFEKEDHMDQAIAEYFETIGSDDDEDGKEDDDDEDNETGAAEPEPEQTGKHAEIGSDSEDEDDESVGDTESELEQNGKCSEAYFHGAIANLGTPYAFSYVAQLGSPMLDSSGPSNRTLTRQNSQALVSQSHYEPFYSIAELLMSADKSGNSASHHAAAMGLKLTAKALFAAGAFLLEGLPIGSSDERNTLCKATSRWRTNKTHDTPAFLLDGLPLGSGEERNSLYIAITSRQLLPHPVAPAVVRAANFSYQPPSYLTTFLDAVRSPTGETEADYHSQQLLDNANSGASLHRALFFLTFGYGEQQAQLLLDNYVEQLVQLTSGVSLTSMIEIDPLFFYARYLLWRQQRSHAKAEKLLAADALRAFRLFKPLSSWFLRADDDIDEQLKAQGMLVPPEGTESEDEDDAYASLIPPPGPDDPETLWEVAKSCYGPAMKSPAMDKLLALAGIKKVKERAVSVAMEVVLKSKRPAGQKPPAMNFLFVGNPGAGKTTVAELLATAMVELKYRENPKPVCTSASDILAGQDPPVDFAKMVKDAKGGTLFIDEAYMFTPAPRGQRANDSNKVQQLLLHNTPTYISLTTHELAPLCNTSLPGTGYATQGYRVHARRHHLHPRGLQRGDQHFASLQPRFQISLSEGVYLRFR